MAFKRWSGGGVRATAILDGVCARCHWAQAGRDGETALRLNKETGPKDRKILGQHTTFLTKCPIQGWAKRSVPPIGHSEVGTAHRSRACPTSALKNGSKSATADFDGRAFAHPTSGKQRGRDKPGLSDANPTPRSGAKPRYWTAKQ